MGRGRQKAKHTKVARDLKYFSPDTNYDSLQRELSTDPRLEEDLEKWPEYSAATDGEYASVEYSEADDEDEAEAESRSA